MSEPYVPYWREVVSAQGDLIITLNAGGRSLTRRYTAKQLSTRRAPQFALRSIKDSMERELAARTPEGDRR